MSEWNSDMDAAPELVEVIVRYAGSRCKVSQPNRIGTSVHLGSGKWGLGSAPDHKKFTHWMHMPPPPD